jgi:hypothetical protein
MQESAGANGSRGSHGRLESCKVQECQLGIEAVEQAEDDAWSGDTTFPLFSLQRNSHRKKERFLRGQTYFHFREINPLDFTKSGASLPCALSSIVS